MAGYSWIQDSVDTVDTGYSWIRCVQLRSAFGCVQPGYRSAFSCVQEPAFSCVLRSAAFCVQLRSAFSCVLRSAAFRNLRSAAFCVQLRSAWIQPGVIQSFWVGILCRQGRYAWTHTCCNPSLAARNVNTHAFLPGPDLCPSTNTKTPNEYMPGLCPSTTNNTKTPIEYMPPLLKFCPAPTHPQQYSF